MSDEQLRQRALKALMFDPLDTAEKITGKSYADDAETIQLGFTCLQQNKMRKRAILAEIGDTHAGIFWNDFLKIIFDLGFKIIQSKRSIEEREDGIVVSPTNVIAAHPEKKLLICANSYVPTDPQKNQIIGSGKLFGSIDVSGLREGFDWYQFLGQISFSFYGDKMQFYFGVNEALVTRLQLVETTAPLCNWPNDEEPTMLYGLLEDKIPDLPDWVKEFMGMRKEK